MDRYRSFWSLRDRIETIAKTNGIIPASLLRAASSISACLIADNGLSSVDGVILDYLGENDFYVPQNRRDLLKDPGDGAFNMWRVLYQERFGEVPSNLSHQEALARIFNDAN